MWHKNFTSCINCQLTSSPFQAKGFCKKCYNKKYHQDNLEKLQNRFKNYRINNLEKEKQRNKQYCLDNKITLQQKHKIYRSENLEKISLADKNYRESEHGRKVKTRIEKIRRARKRSNSTKEQDINLKLILQQKFCSYCGKNENLTVEHIFPVSLGGCNSLNNLTIACASCNSSKHNNDLIDWIMYRNEPLFDVNVLYKYSSYVGEK